MLRISCPNCGTCDESEFHCGGDAHVVRPGPEVSDAEWSEYLFDHENPRGPHLERWCHNFGCGQWFNVARDTLTHEIYAVYRMGDAAPELDQ